MQLDRSYTRVGKYAEGVLFPAATRLVTKQLLPGPYRSLPSHFYMPVVNCIGTCTYTIEDAYLLWFV